MAINAISSNQQTTASGGQLINQSTALGKDDFLKMFVATLKNQDPTSPIDANNFLQQNAMFSELETLQNIQSLLTQNQQSQQDSGKMLTAAYMGREVTATIPPSNQGEIATNTSGIVVGVDLSGDVPNLLLDNGQSVSIQNVTGMLTPGYGQAASSSTDTTGA